MIDFMIIGLPRSATTWAANWLTGDGVFCVHDPLWTMHYSDMDDAVTGRAGDRLAGISCTGIWRWTDWVNRHPARKVILNRDIAEVRYSLRRIGLPVPPLTAALNLSQIDGLHVPYDQLFDVSGAEEIWRYVTDGLPFDWRRHHELRQISIEPRRDRLLIDSEVQRRIAAEVRQ